MSCATKAPLINRNEPPRITEMISLYSKDSRECHGYRSVCSSLWGEWGGRIIEIKCYLKSPRKDLLGTPNPPPITSDSSNVHLKKNGIVSKCLLVTQWVTECSVAMGCSTEDT